SVQCLQRVIYWDAQSTEVRPELEGGEDHVYKAGRISVVPKPRPGLWTVRLLGQGAYSLVVQAKSSVGLHGISLEGGEVTVKRESPAQRFRVVDEAGQTVQTIDSEQVRPTVARFRLVMDTTDEQGFWVQRMDPRLHRSAGP